MWKAVWMILLVFIQHPSFAQNRVTVANAAAIREELGLNAFARNLPFDQYRVAIVDNGYFGYTSDPQHELFDVFLPSRLTRIILGYENIPPEIHADRLSSANGNQHGLHMGMVVRAIAGDPANGPNMKLFYVNSPYMFEAAANAIIEWEEKDDEGQDRPANQRGKTLVICSNNFEAFTNFTERSPIDNLITKVTSKRVIWLNAAGNYGGKVSNHRLATIHNQGQNGFWATLPHEQYFTTFENNVHGNEVTITLNWNKYHPTSLTESIDDLDLDLHVYPESSPDSNRPSNQSLEPKEGRDPPFNEFIVGRRRQVRRNPAPRTNEDIFSRERFVSRLPAGKYFIAVGSTQNRQRVNSALDRFRITITTKDGPFLNPETGNLVESIVYHSRTRDGELQAGALGRGITVGNLGTYSARGFGDGKPDILMERESVRFSDNRSSFVGTSYSSSILGGAVLVYMAAQAGLQQQHLLNFRQENPSQKFWTNLGWQFTQTSELFRNNIPLYQALTQAFGYVNLAVKDRELSVGVVGGDYNNLPSRSELSQEAATNFEERDIFIYTQTPLVNRTIRDPDRREWVPARNEPYRMYWPVGSVDPRTGYITTRAGYTTEQRLVPGHYQTIPGANRTVQVPGDPQIHYWTRRRGSTTRPPQYENSSPMILIRMLRAQSADYSGTDREPKIFKPATPQELRRVVQGN